MIPRVLVIGGLDPSGGAGITADARALQAHGALALPVAAALTVQNRFGVQRVALVEPALWRAALAAACDDGPVHAVKVGLVADADQIAAIAGELSRRCPDAPWVVDPVLSATAGGYAAGRNLVAALRASLVPRCRLLTPNTPELAALLAGDPLAALLAEGCAAVLHKGGHDDGDPVRDRLHTGSATRDFVHPRLEVGPVHGTGCALASAIAARLAHGEELASACGAAIAWLQICLRELPPARAPGPPRPLPIVTATVSGTSPR